MVRGKCGLCSEEADLQDSHFLPKVFYKIVIEGGKSAGESNVIPVTVTPRIALQTSA